MKSINNLYKQLGFSLSSQISAKEFIPLSTVSIFCFDFENDLFVSIYFANDVKADIRFRNKEGKNQLPLTGSEKFRTLLVLISFIK